jgi:hypothetical protein
MIDLSGIYEFIQRQASVNEDHKDKQMKYLMTWMGVTSGSHLGRNDGYPQRKTMIISSTDELVESYREDAQYFILQPVDVKTAVETIKRLS